MNSDEIEAFKGRKVIVKWQDELLGPQEVKGELMEEGDDGMIYLKDGIGVSVRAKGLAVYVAE